MILFHTNSVHNTSPKQTAPGKGTGDKKLRKSIESSPTITIHSKQPVVEKKYFNYDKYVLSCTQFCNILDKL